MTDEIYYTPKFKKKKMSIEQRRNIGKAIMKRNEQKMKGGIEP